MTTGIVTPMSLEVCALNAFTNSMMLMPCWPRAGPTGGAGEAWPPGAWSLIVVRTFFIGLPPRGIQPREFERRHHVSDSKLLDLVEADLDRGLAAEDTDKDLQAGGVL